MMYKKITEVLHTFGFLRLGLLAMVLTDILLRPRPGTTFDYETTSGLVALLAAVMSPILFMLLLLDAIMTGVYLSGMPVARKPVYRAILITDLVLAIGFFLYWLPYFKSINS